MKKLFIILSLMVCIFTFGACSNGGTDNNMSNDKNENQQEQVEPISSLIGTWKEVDGDKTYMEWYEAEITSDSIELSYCDWNEKRELLWKGSYSDLENPVTVWEFISYNNDFKPGWFKYREFDYVNGELISRQINGEAGHPTRDNLIHLRKIN